MKLSQPFKPISISLSPNTRGDDVILALSLLFMPWKWIKGGESAGLESQFKKYLNARHALTFNSARSALYAIVKALELTKDDEVLLQAFTCNAVPNPVLWAGAKPVYVDIDESLNIDPVDLEKKITPKSRAVIVQHTFGVPAKIETISEIARRHNLVLIEDCAHALGAEYNGRPVGTFGDISFFSFGRDKIISSVWGGMAVTNYETFAKKIAVVHRNLPHAGMLWTFRQILHPVFFSIIIPTYYVFGRYLLAALKAVRGVGLAVSQKERAGQMPDIFPKKMPNALAALAFHQFKKLEKYNEHRREIAGLYFSEFHNSPPNDLAYSKRGGEGGLQLPKEVSGAVYLRFNILHPHAKEIIKNAKRKRILLGDWYSNVIDPKGTDFKKMQYETGSCPRAEDEAPKIINLPTHINISQKDAMKVVEFLKK